MAPCRVTVGVWTREWHFPSLEPDDSQSQSWGLTAFHGTGISDVSPLCAETGQPPRVRGLSSVRGTMAQLPRWVWFGRQLSSRSDFWFIWAMISEASVRGTQTRVLRSGWVCDAVATSPGMCVWIFTHGLQSHSLVPGVICGSVTQLAASFGWELMSRAARDGAEVEQNLFGSLSPR